MNSKFDVRGLTRAAIFAALLIASQAATAPLANPLITGSIVNAILALTAVVCAAKYSIAVAVISPILATLFGIGPRWELVPFIALGNSTLVLAWYFITRHRNYQLTRFIISAAVAAVLKFVVLYIGVAKIAVPFILSLPENAAAAISATFSLPQLITASIGGAIAVLASPLILRAKKAGE